MAWRKPKYDPRCLGEVARGEDGRLWKTVEGFSAKLKWVPVRLGQIAQPIYWIYRNDRNVKRRA